ncbi:MAG: hypothetical protein UT03_C0046G0003, partial [Candidatus Moranbacteria bacterium GW2011_GWD2_38_7]
GKEQKQIINKYIRYLLTFRYIKLFSYWSARGLANKLQESHKHRYTYYYGCQIIYGGINKGLLLILLGILLNILPQLLLTTLSFVSLRIWTGGLHFSYIYLTLIIHNIRTLSKIRPHNTNHYYNNILNCTYHILTVRTSFSS